jgi:hypothetical protein
VKSFPAHRPIELWALAARQAGLPIAVTSFTDHETHGYLRLPGRLRNLLDPWRAAGRILRLARSGKVVFLREFLTLPLLVAAPLFLPARRSLWLVSVHNLQRAAQRPLHRIALRLLVRLGFGLIVLESFAGVDRIGIRSPHPRIRKLPLVAPPERRPTGRLGSRPCVALLGRPRAEKDLVSGIELAARAIGETRTSFELLVATPDGPLLSAAAARGLPTLDTSTPQAYGAALERATVVLLSYRREDYELRSSGVVLDAAAAGAAIVCPDYPVLRDQVSSPVPIGVTYHSPADLPAALDGAAALSQQKPENFAIYLDSRSLAAVGTLLREFTPTVHPPGAPVGAV